MKRTVRGVLEAGNKEPARQLALFQDADAGASVMFEDQDQGVRVCYDAPFSLMSLFA